MTRSNYTDIVLIHDQPVYVDMKISYNAGRNEILYTVEDMSYIIEDIGTHTLRDILEDIGYQNIIATMDYTESLPQNIENYMDTPLCNCGYAEISLVSYDSTSDSDSE